MSALRRRGGRCNPDSPISGQAETARSCACSRPPTPFSSHKLWENDWRPRMERVQLNGADIEYDVRGSGAPVVFIHGAILSDGFVPVIEQPGIAENFQIVDYRRRGCAGSSRAVAGMTMQGKAYLHRWIIPHWGTAPLAEVRTMGVEAWLRGLPLAQSSCAKIRGLFSVLFNHACRAFRIGDRA